MLVDEESEQEKILVTGASGFIGKTIVDQLELCGKYDVYGLVGKKSQPVRGKDSESKFFPVDISEPLKFIEKKGLEKTSILIHTAGLAHQFKKVGRADFWGVNVRGTENVCRLAAGIGVKHFILISSVAVYGEHESVEIDETFPCRPEGFYAQSKLESERKALEYCAQNNMALTILRPATVIGEGDRGNTSRLIKVLESGKFLWIGSGKNKKSLIYKGDVAAAVRLIVRQEAFRGAEVYNLTGEPLTMREIVETIARRLGKKAPRLEVPENLARGMIGIGKKFFFEGIAERVEKTLEKWLSDDIFSGTKFKQKFDFEPETQVTEALEKQVDHYLKQKNKK